MKKFVKDWLLPPKILSKLIEYKIFTNNRYNKNIFQNNLKDSETGNRCFIVGTGSSLKEQDLKLLKNEIVIGVSGLYNHEDIKVINPKYYVNPSIFKSHSKYYEEEKFLHYLIDMDKELVNTTIMFFDILDKKYIDKYKLFKNKKVIWKSYKTWNNSDIKTIDLGSLPSIWSVSESAIQIALYLGFERIYLLGFDHDWFNGLFNYAFDNNKARKHFNESSEEICKKFNIDSEFQMIRHAKIFNKYKKLYKLKKNIYNANANKNSYVDTFPKVVYEDLFK